jgi:hypothetical protein
MSNVLSSIFVIGDLLSEMFHYLKIHEHFSFSYGNH